MYFPVGWPKYIKQPQGELREPTYVISSCDRMLFAIVSDEEISIWYCKPAVQIVSYTQSEKTLTQYGKYCKAEWKPDSSTLAVITSKCYIVLFKVDLDISVPNHHCLYVTAESSGRSHSYHGEGSQTTESVPAIKLTLLKQVQLPCQITCCLSIREELAVATEDGHISRLNWSGTENTKASVCLKDLSVAADMLQSRGTKLTIEDGHVVQMEYSPIIGGYCLVMSSGKAVLMMSLAVHRNDGNSSGVWASEMTDAVCQAVNHRYRLIAYGCSGAYGVVYTINEVEGLLEASHKLQVSCKNFPAMSRTVGAVTCMKWTPDGTSLAMVWKRGGFALWSVFGSLLACTVGGDYSFSQDYLKLFPPSVKSMEWGLEGYQLWMIGTQSHDGEDNNQYTTVDHTDIIQLQFAKSSLTVNPCMTNHEHVFLQGEDKLYLNTGDITSRSCQYGGDESQILVGSKQWQFIPISHSYLAGNWPIRYSCVDKAGQCVAVAGKTGLAHYALFNRKWKLFGNETQERDMVVSGGIAWWKDFICVACYNIIGHRDEIRCYPRESKLDNTFANIQKVPSQVLLINIFKDTLLIFCVDSHVMIFNLERINTQSNPAVEITRVQEVGLSSYIPHPVCVTGVVLTSVKMDVAPLAASQRTSQSAKDSDSLLLNVAGKLLVFQRDKSGPQIKQKEKSSLQKIKPLPFSSPAVVATNVENLWTTSRSVTGKLQLTEALWLACGCQGMKVWLPLFPKNETQAQNFMSKRIMLPFRVDIYPLAVLFEEAVILGVASDASMFRYAAKSSFHNPSRNLHDLPYCGVERTSQLYLHHILKQLLKRNLGVQALDLARCCTELSYFSHVLELLLHEVLEAEATSKEPIPDPLLPRVVAFIQEFPEYLQTFVQCARKTEVALWPHLFTTVGNPKDLFEECLYSGRLETAASYLIILQNLEKPIASRQHATLLLDSAVEAKQWDLAQDLVRFLKAIDPNDANASPPLAFHLSKMQANSYIGSPPPTECDTFTFSSVSNVSRIRSSSVTAETAAREQQKDKVKLTHTKSDNQMSVKRPSPKPVQTNSSADQVFIDSLLCRHARKLLSTNRLKDLGCFAANIKDFQLVAWLKKENLRSGKVEDFVSALRDLHHQFHWPLPVLSLSAFQQLKSKAYSSPCLANLSLLDEDVPKGGCNGANNTLVPQSGDNKGKPIPKNLSFLSTDTSDDVVLRPQMSKTDDSSLATLEISDSSSLFGDFDFLADSCSSLESLTPELELLSQEIISKGPEQSELELRYLFQVLLEGGCLEWALIIAIVLRDSSAVIRTINTASMTDTPLETVARMREGLSYLELWSDTECVGYKPFLHAIRGQIQLLTKIAEQAPPTLKLNPEIINSDAPLEEGQMSPGTMSIHEGDVHPESPTVPEPHKHNECAVS